MSEPPAVDVLIAHDSGDLRSVEFLASALDGAGIRPQLLDQRAFDGAGSDPLPILDPVRVLVVAVGGRSLPDFLFTLGRTAERIERPPFLILLGRADDGTAEKFGLSGEGVFDFRSGINENIVAGFVERVRWALGLPPDEFEVSKRAPVDQAPPTPAGPEASPVTAPARPSISDIWAALESPAKTTIAQANAVAQERRSSLIHSEDLLIGLYRESGGPTASILEDKGVSERTVGEIVAQQIPTIRPAIALPNVPPLESPPALSTHTSQALSRAFDAARAEDPSGPIGTRHLLYGLVSLEDCTVAEQLRDAGVTSDFVRAWRPPEPEPVSQAIPEALAGFRSDTTGGPDLLNIGPEVDAIATVLAARTVDPPLALGLFGDWGTGKTFFMDDLEKRIGLLAAREAVADRHGDDRVYCRNIVQLRFNAWHYIDVDLWASLANAIFEGLDDALAKSRLLPEEIKDRGKERAGLLLERAQVETGLEEARQEQVEADRLAAEAQAELDRVDERYDELVQAVKPEAILAGGLKVAMDQPEVADQFNTQKERVNAKIDEAATELGIKPDTLRKALAGGTANGYVAAGRALLQDNASRVWVPIAALAVLAVIVAVALDAAGFDSAALVGAGVSLLVGIAGGLRPLIEAGGRVSGVIADAREEGERLVEEQRMKVRQQALADKSDRDQKAIEAAAKVQTQKDALDGVDERLSQLRPGREMADFVRVRQSSNEYRSRLGVVARARDDFEELSRLLAKDKADNDVPAEAAGAGETGAADPKAIERIILYIDDLDRCKEKEVVAVLQAVHLLLAFPLFVVVVAVDPRWLLHSLRVESGVFAAKQEGLTDDDEDGLGWEATPLNYLEKIFQIPFALRPMGQTGFGAIVNHLVGYEGEAVGADHTDGRGEAEAFRPAAGEQPVGDSGNGSGPGPAKRSPAEPTGLAQQAGEGDSQPDAAAASARAEAASHAPDELDVEARPVEMNPRALDISNDERLYMAQMYPLIGTPRGAKRFVNVYRLLKASHPVAEQGRFADPQVHRPVLLLLASLTGFPRETAEILRDLVENEPEGLWWDYVLSFAENAVRDTKEKEPLRAASWEQLIAKLRQVRAAGSQDLNCADMRLRARRVARYSFESSRILFMEAEDAGSAKAPPGRPRSTASKPVRKPRTAKAPSTKPPTAKARAS
jgi:hypothetical protein